MVCDTVYIHIILFINKAIQEILIRHIECVGV